MDFADSPEHAAFRREFRAWLDANLTDDLKVEDAQDQRVFNRGQRSRPSTSNLAGGTLRTKCARHAQVMRTVPRPPRAVVEYSTAAVHGRARETTVNPQMRNTEPSRLAGVHRLMPTPQTRAGERDRDENNARGRCPAWDKCPAQSAEPARTYHLPEHGPAA